MKTQKRVRTHEKKQTFFPADRFATEIASRIESDLSKATLFDHSYDSNLLKQLVDRQIGGTLKRYQQFDGYDRTSLEEQAFDNFLVVNQDLGRVNELLKQKDKDLLGNSWYRCNGGSSVKDKSFTLADVLWTAKQLVKQVLGPFDDELFHTLVKHGPGTTVGVSYDDTSVDRKFSFPMSCTEAVKRLHEKHIRFNTTLDRAIQDLNGSLIYGDVYEIVEASQGCTVDKDSGRRRFIAKEPTLNMFYQQGLMQQLYVCLRRFGLDVKFLPSKHRELARQASIDRLNGTIDFAHASDSNAYELVKWLLPNDWFLYLDMVRTPFMEIRGDKHRINMFSTMGNATTFPLETLVFWAIASSCHHYSTSLTSRLVNPKTWAEVSVFGDDCIVPTDTCPLFIEVCGLLGFSVNKDKSFIDKDDCFRESCGGDYYQGFDVRPYKFKAPRNQKVSSLEPWLYTILNNILPKYITCFGCVESIFHHDLGDFILRLFEQYKLSFKFVPQDFPDDAGFKVASRRSLCYLVEDLSVLGVKFAPIYRCESSDMFDFAMVKFRYPKRRKQNDYLRYAMQLYRMTEALQDEDKRTMRRVVKHKQIFLQMMRDFLCLGQPADEYFSDEGEYSQPFDIHKSPVRKKGGYVQSRVQHHFDVYNV